MPDQHVHQPHGKPVCNAEDAHQIGCMLPQKDGNCPPGASATMICQNDLPS